QKNMKRPDPDQPCRRQFGDQGENPCDLGDVCDGQHPECPTSGLNAGCQVEVPEVPPGQKLQARCTVNKPDSGKPKCIFQGFKPGAATGVRTNVVRAADVRCGRTPLTVKVVVTPTQSGDDRLLEGLANLKLSKTGRQLLNRGGSVQVCVRVQIKLGKAVLRTEA